MSEELKIIANEDGTFSEYDDTFDITIHCRSEEEQNEVLAKLNSPQPKMGQWIKNAEEWQNVDPPYICSECGRASLRQENFCCSCGADMRGDADADSD